jgi:hypothetical protein
MRYGGSGLLAKLGCTAIGVLAFLWVINDPTGAGQAAHALAGLATRAAGAFGTAVSAAFGHK